MKKALVILLGLFIWAGEAYAATPTECRKRLELAGIHDFKHIPPSKEIPYRYNDIVVTISTVLHDTPDTICARQDRAVLEALRGQVVAARKEAQRWKSQAIGEATLSNQDEHNGLKQSYLLAWGGLVLLIVLSLLFFAMSFIRRRYRRHDRFRGSDKSLLDFTPD